ncbi:MAG: geranylgeranylglyceryl/heptaprenylglyceryl phosphate synthase [Calditrichia bacterium]
MNHTTFEFLTEKRQKNNKLFAILIDPDKLNQDQISNQVPMYCNNGADLFLLGSSHLTNHYFDSYVEQLKRYSRVPVLLFPGNVFQISAHADALLFLSVLSGRNPEHLIGAHIHAAPLVKAMGIEAISMAYLLIESGKLTAAQFMNNSLPIPRDKSGLAVAHALAAQYLGFKTVYLEAGSGAELSVPEEMIRAVRSHIDIPLFVGGGIRTPEEAHKKSKAGADIVVIGNHFENTDNHRQIREFATAIHEGI